MTVPTGFPLPWQIQTIYKIMITYYKFSFSGSWEMSKTKKPDFIIFPPASDFQNLLQPPDLSGINGSRPCENALNTSKVESYGRCLRNQQTEARVALVSYIGVRKCCLGRVSGPNSHSRTIKRLDSRPDRFKQS
ncbi:hypothetical protein ACXM5X_29395 [Pseudomonas saponiphila]|uniref:hypothetical protein n=1 Tax=Pseudomonas sp. TMW22090 TaxID=2506434 RepID=UPI001F100A04|nr:hypothetical protein [Pseudomonas sp. TMW22090]MCH4880856.1 hypothetical protein [Pseudomonas sp. TMW22090]